MSFPKIVFNAVTLQFSYPGRNAPDRDSKATRQINTASSGVTEQIFERRDTFLEFDMDVIPDADAAAWNAFLDWADQGNQFDYYPDAAVASFTAYTLENNDLKLKYRSPGTWSLPGIIFRKVV